MIRRAAIARKVQVKRRRTGPPRRSSRVLDPDYLDFIRTLPCWACHRRAYEIFAGEPGIFRLDQGLYGRLRIRAEAAHVGFSTSKRGASQKFSDRESIPLCKEHHVEGPESIHKLNPDPFFAHHGADRDTVIRSFQKLYAEHCR